jgi:hypothetical protein
LALTLGTVALLQVALPAHADNGAATPLSLALNGLTISACQDPKDDDVLIVQFDVKTRKFSTTSTSDPGRGQRQRLRAVSTGRPIVIRIVNPNSFRDTYKIEAFVTDFHQVNLADIFKNLPGFSTAFPGVRAAGVAPKAVPENDIKDVREELKKRYRKFEMARDAVRGLLNPADLDKWATLDDKLLFQAVSGETNATIRVGVANEINTYLGIKTSPNVGTDGDLDNATAIDFLLKSREFDQPLQQAANALRQTVENLTDAKAEWKKQYDMDKASLKEPEKSQAAKLNENVEADGTESVANKVITRLNEIRENDLAKAQRLTAAVMDKVAAPTILEKQIEAQGDGLDITITVTTKSSADLLALGDPLPAGGAPGGAEDGRGPGRAAVRAAGAAGEGDIPPSTPPAGNRQIVPDPTDFTIKPYRYKLPVHKRWVLDASAGFAVTGLYEERFTSRSEVTASGETKNIVRRTGRDEYEFKPALFVHYYRTNQNGWAYGPALGLVTSGTTITRYLPGLSLVRGQEKRVILTIGAVFGNVDRLNGYTVGGVGPTDGNALTKSVSKTSWFAALTIQVGRL